ncbi:MAG: hypothetical protein DHS20C07_18670 [Methyloligella sp.]|nr:MAG: hypothetical protein DHS20C07_18670 [Methyloligella sp.]
MEFLYSSFDLLTSSLFSINWHDGAGALLLVLVSALFIYSGFPIAFVLIGTAVLFASYALVSGGMTGAAFTPFAEHLEKILSSKTLLALPLFLFTAVIIERAFIVENLILKFIDHWRHKSEAMLFTVSLLDIIVSGLAALICVLFAPLVALRLPLLLKTRNHKFLEAKNISSLFAKGLLKQPSFIPITVMLVIIAELLSTVNSSMMNAAKTSQPVLGQEITKYTTEDFFIASLIPGILFTALYCLYQLCLMFKYPNEYVFKNIEKEKDLKVSSKTELLKSFFAPALYGAIIFSALLIVKLSILEVAAIAAVGSIFLASHKLAPEKNNISLNAVISFLSLFFLSKIFTLEISKFEATPLNGAVFAISIFFIGYIVYGIYNVVVPLMRNETIKEKPITHSFMGIALMETLEQTSRIITLLIAASLYVLVFKGLGGDQLLKLFYENFTGNNNLVILLSFMILVLVGRIFTPVIALLIVVPVLVPHLLMLVKTGIPELNTLWIGILIIITLQILGYYSISMNGIDKNINNQSSLEMLKPQIYQTKIPLIIVQIIILALCWLFPWLVLGLGAAM